MSNYVTNIVKFEGNYANILNLFNLMKGEDENIIIDFNKIIPCFNCNEDIRNDLRMCNWGTKWNAHNQSIMPINCYNVKFDTSWDAPIPVLTKLSSFYNDVVITHFYSNENEILGKVAYCNGSVLYNIVMSDNFKDDEEFKYIKSIFDIANGVEIQDSIIMKFN